MDLLRRLPGLVLLCLLCAVVPGCKHSTEQLGKNDVTFQVKGNVIAVDTERGEVTLQHDAIPGFMEAMTMPYTLQRREVAAELAPGDVIRARLTVQKDSDGEYHHARLDQIAVIAQKHPNFKPSSQFHVPAVGDQVPDFRMVDQDGKPFHTGDLKGRAVLLTFIYTRCPLNDFCPRMNRNLAAVSKVLSGAPGLRDRSMLLSVSFDPAFDTPAVLKAYGSSYTGSAGFSHWKFARPDAAVLTQMREFFNVGLTPEGDGTLTHSLSTVLIDPAGRIAAWYPGSEWTPEEAAAKMLNVLAAGKSGSQ